MTALDARVAKLVADLQRDWEQVGIHSTRAVSVDAAKGDPEAAFVALSLDHAYQAFETFLVRVERGLGLPERTGQNWHAQILFDAAYPIARLRPAIYPVEAAPDWEAVMRFRHFLRHAYAVALDAGKLRGNAERLERAVAASSSHVDVLIDALFGETK